MLGASSRRKPPGDVLPVAASCLHAGSHVRKRGSAVKIDTARDVQPGEPSLADSSTLLVGLESRE